MAIKKAVPMQRSADNGLGLYLQRVFSLMFGAVMLTAVASYLTIYAGGITLFVNQGGFSALYYIVLFGGLGLSIFAQARAFHMSPATGGLLLAVYSVLMGFVMTPLIWGALAVNPASILQAFVLASVMFGCMALFGYKTARDLSFLGVFLFIGMIGLILIGLASMIWPLGGTFATIVCAIGVLVFALFTAYDMQFQKKAYAAMGDETQKNQLAVLGALHLYISFIAMFQYILSLLNRR
ncbi:MAG: Bax inhibitor-1/YccA family protein [Alphaproteobacteria bacterium]|nr:Bax inhibitor-1/YccA family protein [Alphaproteobacteria bacterium]